MSIKKCINAIVFMQIFNPEPTSEKLEEERQRLKREHKAARKLRMERERLEVSCKDIPHPHA